MKPILLLWSMILVLSFGVLPAHGQMLNTAKDYYNRGVAQYKNGQLDSAIANYNKAIEINPRFVQAYIARGLARVDKGDFDNAIADYTKAIEFDPR